MQPPPPKADEGVGGVMEFVNVPTVVTGGWERKWGRNCPCFTREETPNSFIGGENGRFPPITPPSRVWGPPTPSPRCIIPLHGAITSCNADEFMIEVKIAKKEKRMISLLSFSLLLWKNHLYSPSNDVKT